ncbi:MAG: restriction endonuclease subunit S [Microcoleus sp.]
MSFGWKDCQLGDVITLQRGFDIVKKQLQPGIYDVIFSSGIGGTHNEFKVKAPGVVIGRKGTLGNVFFTHKDFWPTDTTLWVKDFHGNDEKFAYYFLQTMHLEQLDCGAANPTLNRNHIHTLPIRYPPLPIQRKIAAILSTYDRLIENNTRRIEILEEMARSLYREWFVKFRFPGHEQAQMVDSELGAIPEGWEVKQLDDIVLEIIDYRGKTPKKLGGDWSESGILAISAKNIKQGKLINLDKSNCVDEALYKKWMKSELKQGDILMTSEAPLGELYYLVKHHKFCLSQRVYSIRANPNIIHPPILFSALYSPLIQEQIYARQSGTTVVGIRQTELRKVSVIVPLMKLQISAARMLDDFFNAIETLQVKNDNLRKTRDLLLPRLISGEIDVENLDIKTGETAA